jgi:hypothetical protein
MARQPPPTLVPGRPLAEWAGQLNAALAFLYAAANVTAAAPLYAAQDQGGTRISLAQPPEFWALLTAQAGAGLNSYSWQQVKQDQITGFAWDAEGLSGDGTDPAYEASGNGGVPVGALGTGAVVWLRKVLGQWVFERTAGGGVGGNVTINTTTNIAGGVTWVINGGTVQVTNNTWNFAGTTVINLAGPTVNVTVNTPIVIGGGITLTVTGGTVQLTNVTIDVHTGTVVNITDNTTWNITNTKVWNVTGGGLTWTNITVVFGTGTVVNLTVNQTWTITTGATWTITGGTTVINSTVVFGGPSFTLNQTTNQFFLCGDLLFDVCPTPLIPAPVVKVNVPLQPVGGIQIKGPTPAPVVIDPGATLPIQGGTVDLSGTVVTGGMISSTLNHYTGTTADAYAVVFDLTNAAGILGAAVIKNTDPVAGGHSMTYQATVTDFYGTVNAFTGTVAPGAVPTQVPFEGVIHGTSTSPYKEVKLEVKSTAAGQPAGYDVYVSTGAGAIVTGSGVPVLQQDPDIIGASLLGGSMAPLLARTYR